MGAAAAAGGYLLGASDDDEASPPAAPPPPPAEVAGLPAGWKLCSNERFGYALGFPVDWHAPAPTAESECTFFDPEPIALPGANDAFAALEVAPAQDSFQQVVAGLSDERFEETLERRELTLSGRPAVEVVSRSTGEGLLDRGTESATYVVNRGSEPPLVLRTVRLPNVNWEERLRILDEAARTLILFEPERARKEGAPPDAVLHKRAAMLAAADVSDYDGLAELADPNEFEYTFGGPVDGGPAAYWRRQEQAGDDPSPAEALAAILRMPYTLSRGIYVWPFAYDKTEDELTSYERRLLAPLGQGGAFADGYLGWRAGIRPDGRWVFFVAGD